MHDIKHNLGHNFTRLTHYPNDKYLYQLTDSLGIVTVEEVPNIKNIDFSEEVQEQNVREMIRRDRNHPSIFFWSMGNETSDAADSQWAWEEDTTRIIHLRKGEEGGDYIQHTHNNLDMENLLRVTVRGWFDEDDAPGSFNAQPENGQHSSTETWQHEMARVQGGSVRGLLGHNCVAWLYEDHGADREYLNCILKHINPKGWVDMYRQPKYLYWLTKAHYTDNPTVFIHPHFWRQQYIGLRKPIVVDSNCDQVELFVNDVSVGVQRPSKENFNTVTFSDVLVEEGELKAVGTKNGEQYTHSWAMPGAPAKVVLSASHQRISADRSGVAIVTANILDENDQPVFDASNTLQWSVEGPGSLVGYHTYETDIMKHEEMRGTGYTVVPVSNVVRAGSAAGSITVSVSSPGLDAASITIDAVAPNDPAGWLSLPVLNDEGRTAVQRDAEYEDRLVVIEELLRIRENHNISGEDTRQALRRFISRRNRNYNDNSIGFEVLLETLQKRVNNSNGVLIADDFNFLAGLFNTFRMIEKAIDDADIPAGKAEKMKAEYAQKIIAGGASVDLQEELKKIER
jgi:hypothetical protein